MTNYSMVPPTLTVITATRNCEKSIGGLIQSLRQQTDRDFSWFVADGISSDSTLALVNGSGLPNLHTSSERDFSIYDALNRAVRLSKGDYYLVLGADDVIRPDCISNYRKAVSHGHADIVVASVETFNAVRRPMRGRRWLRGGNAICASHSVGTLIRRNLHERFGYYSNRYVNAADMHFIMTCVADPDTCVSVAPFIAGSFSNDGISSTDELASLGDFFRLQLAFGESASAQFLLYVARLARSCWRLSKRTT